MLLSVVYVFFSDATKEDGEPVFILFLRPLSLYFVLREFMLKGGTYLRDRPVVAGWLGSPVDRRAAQAVAAQSRVTPTRPRSNESDTDRGLRLASSAVRADSSGDGLRGISSLERAVGRSG